MRPELLAAVQLRAHGVPTVGELLDLIVEHRDIARALTTLGLPAAEWSVVALRDGRYVLTAPQDFTAVLRALTRLHRDDFIYDGRPL